MAENKKGITGENLLQILESRLDNVVYRAGFGTSRAQARQLVNHGHFDVNGRKVDIPSYLVKTGDVITVREIKKDNKTIDINLRQLRKNVGVVLQEPFIYAKTIKENIEVNKAKPVPAWLEKDNDKLQVKVVKLASREDVDIAVEEHLIVELYSK